MTTPIMPNHILVGSEKLFRTKAPWRINNSLIGQLSADHRLLLFSTENTKDYNKKITTKLSRSLYNECQREYKKLTFIGYENECRMVSDLQAHHGFKFDCVVLINNPFREAIYRELYQYGNLYNFYTKQDGVHLAGADINEYVKTKLPAQMSNRLALEVLGCVLYGSYGLDALQSNYSKPKYI
jgi:hypothetical protein